VNSSGLCSNPRPLVRSFVGHLRGVDRSRYEAASSRTALDQLPVLRVDDDRCLVREASPFEYQIGLPAWQAEGSPAFAKVPGPNYARRLQVAFAVARRI
jgi:hypothetical protein